MTAGRFELDTADREALRGRRILVVGGAGFIGSSLVRFLLSAQPSEVRVVDNLLSSERDNLPDDPCVAFVEGSVTQDSILRELPEDLELAFHLATFHGNQNSIADPLADHEHNTLATLKLFERLRTISSLRKVIYASAGCTVAEKTYDKAEATTEEAPVSLYHDSPYQMSKIFGEFYANYYWKQHGLPVVKARFQNVYGPGEVLGAGAWRGTAATVWRNVTPTFVWRALHHEALPVENAGLATRDFIEVDDIARGLVACALQGGAGAVYNLATGCETSILELATLVNELTNNPTPIDLRPARSWDRSGTRYGSPEKAKRMLGFEARIGLREGLTETITWTRENRSRIAACIARHAHRMGVVT